jgi:predicted dehydrogenase
MSKVLNVGVVGYGFATQTFHAPLISSLPGLRLAAISTSAPAKVQADWPEAAIETTPEALFMRPDIDLVVIPTPNDTHFPLAALALAAGKHVIVDKPFTVTLAEARQLDAQARSAGLVLSVFHNRRWDADFLTLRQVVASGQLGAISHFESHFDRYRPQVRARWRELAVPGSGLWFDLGSHLLDQALQLFGLPESITLDIARQRENAQADDFFHAILRYGQTRVILHGGSLVTVPAARFTVHGQQGSFIKYGLDPQEDALKARSYPPSPAWGRDPLAATLTVWNGDSCESTELACVPGDYPAYYGAVRDAILGLGPNPVTAAEAMRVIALLELGLQSAQEGRTLTVSANMLRSDQN